MYNYPFLKYFFRMNRVFFFGPAVMKSKEVRLVDK